MDGEVIYDPRTDLHEDSLWWQRLLELASEIDMMLFGILHGLRCWGLRIVTANEKGLTKQLVLRPGSECDVAEYVEFRHVYMMPYGELIVKLMTQLTREVIK